VSVEREWRNRQTRTVQVRVPERAWGFNSPLAHTLRPESLQVRHGAPCRSVEIVAVVSVWSHRLVDATDGRREGGIYLRAPSRERLDLVLAIGPALEDVLEGLASHSLDQVPQGWVQ
jgi:hypothetical protein